MVKQNGQIAFWFAHNKQNREINTCIEEEIDMKQEPELFADAYVQYGPMVVWANGFIDKKAVDHCGQVKRITPKHIWIQHKNNGLQKFKKLDYQGCWQITSNKAKLFLWFERDPLTAFISNGL